MQLCAVLSHCETWPKRIILHVTSLVAPVSNPYLGEVLLLLVVLVLVLVSVGKQSQP